MIYSENALLTKSMTMYGKRLTREQYADMLACKSVGELATYLKEKTPYKKYLEKINTASIHRGWLEAVLKNSLFLSFEALSRYAYAIGSRFYEYFVIKSEASYLLRVISAVGHNSTDGYLFPIFEHFTSQSKLPFQRLSDARSVKDILDALAGTDYYGICARFVSEDGALFDVTSVSRALDEYESRRALEIVGKSASGRHKKEVDEFVRSEADFYNVVVISRIKALRVGNVNLSVSLFLQSGGSLPEKTVRALIDAEDNAEMIRVLEKTKYGKHLSGEAFDHIEQMIREIRYQKSRRDFRFSNHPLIVTLSYARLLENEVKNVIHIIEGIRYRISPEEIRSLLVGTG